MSQIRTEKQKFLSTFSFENGVKVYTPEEVAANPGIMDECDDFVWQLASSKEEAAADHDEKAGYMDAWRKNPDKEAY